MMDTSGYLALREGRREAHHCQTEVQLRRVPVYVTSPVIIETHRRLLFDFGRQAALDFLAALYRSSTRIVRPNESDELRALLLLKKYSDSRLTLSDALVFSVMLRLGIKRAFTYDRRHYWTLGFTVIPPLDL